MLKLLLTKSNAVEVLFILSSCSLMLTNETFLWSVTRNVYWWINIHYHFVFDICSNIKQNTNRLQKKMILTNNIKQSKTKILILSSKKHSQRGNKTN